MPFYLPPRTQTNRELAPSGEHLAVCCSFVQLGTQEGFDGKKNPKIRLTWELLDQFNSKGYPFLIGRTYNVSTHPSSSLILDLEAWLGQKLNERFDFEELIGRVALVSIQHKTGPSGDYAALVSVMAPPRGTELRCTPRSERVFYTISPHDPVAFEGLPEWVGKLVATSPEFLEATGQVVPPPPPAEPQRHSLPGSSSLGRDLDDDIPF